MDDPGPRSPDLFPDSGYSGQPYAEAAVREKSDAEGSNFYYIGDLKVLGDSVETTIANDAGVQLPIVNFRFVIDKPVEEKLYTYLCE